MNFPEAIERAKSALEKRRKDAEVRWATDGSWLRDSFVEQLKETIHLDTEALQALHEWKPEEKE